MSLKSKSSSPVITFPKVLLLYAGLLIVWATFRAFFHYSVWVEEIIIKGIIFSLPLLILPLPSKSPLQALGITTTNFFKSVSLGIGAGIALGLAGVGLSFLRGEHLFPTLFPGLTSEQVGAFIILALITAFWEQLLFSGYFLAQLKPILTEEIPLVIMVSLMFALIHLPSLVFVQQLSNASIAGNLLILSALGAGCAILRLRTGNLIAPIMAHTLWGITLYLFR